jgi:N-acetylmuramoyl-L-alanine amidase
MAGLIHKVILVFLLATISDPGVFCTRAWGYETDDQPGYFSESDAIDTGGPGDFTPLTRPKDIQERLRKFNLALKALGIPEENSPLFRDFPPSFLVSGSEVDSRLPFFDPDKGLQRYLSLDALQLSLFRDQLPSLFHPPGATEFVYPFSPLGSSQDSAPLIERLRIISQQVKQPLRVKPLQGLKVLLDPGHMGTPDWDEITGKYVRYGGKKVSEGQIALWTSYLVANELEKLGAEVHLTHDEPGTVAATAPFSFDPAPYLSQYFYNSIDSWMSQWFHLGDAAFVSRVKNATETQKAFSDPQKLQFFVGGEDLEARARLIDTLQPHVVINVHYDASQVNRLQNEDNTIEAFVPGGIRLTETGSRIFRSQHLKHLLEVRRWNESVNLASHIMGEMSTRLKLPLLSKPEAFTGIKVRDGVYARNLYLNRRNLSALQVFLECLHYDHVSEFKRLTTQKTLSGTYRGRVFLYPPRVGEVAQGIRNGVLRYFREYPL